MTKLFAYIDETGDLGDIHKSPSSSPRFGMACILVDETGAMAVRFLIQELKDRWQIPGHKNLNWKEHIRTDHEKRKFIAQRLSELPNTQLLYVYTDKQSVTGTYTRERGRLYNYVAGKLFKNILYAARNWGSGPASVTIRYGHVKKFDHEGNSRPYLMNEIGREMGPVLMKQVEELEWVDARKYKESDAADLLAGILHVAITPDKYGNVEGSYLKRVWNLVRQSELCGTGDKFCSIPLGFMPMPEYKNVPQFDWFWCHTCPRLPVKS